MDIKTTPPEQYAEWLKSLGVPEKDIPERMAHDALRALSAQLKEMGVPEGFEDFVSEMDEVLAQDAVARTLR